tara:strand:- start:95 stop:496 length:402 start_codon:yes stop_codon:yes gene_type:complete
MKEEFHGVVKLITGEEIFALISIEQTDEDPVIMLQSPVIMKMLSNGTGQYVKIKPWLELSDEDLYLIKPDKIVTMSEVKDKQVIHFYERYLNDENVEIVIDGKVELSDQIGYISTVEKSRKLLEELYKLNIEN